MYNTVNAILITVNAILKTVLLWLYVVITDAAIVQLQESDNFANSLSNFDN